MIKRILILAICLSVGFSFAQLQQIKNDFVSINNNYLNINRLSMSVSFKVYENDNSSPTEVETGFYKLQDGKINNKSFGVEIIYDKSGYVAIDDELKTVSFDSLSTSLSTVNSKFFPASVMDTLFMSYQKVSLTRINNDLRRYDFYFENGEFSKVEVYANITTMFINKIVNFYRDPVEVSDGVFKNIKTSIEFTNIDTNPTFTNEFDISRIVLYNNNTYSLSPQYSSYRLIKHYETVNTN